MTLQKLRGLEGTGTFKPGVYDSIRRGHVEVFVADRIRHEHAMLLRLTYEMFYIMTYENGQVPAMTEWVDE